MLARGILGSGRARGVSFWPFPNSFGWWWLISSVFLISISCHKTTHANGYCGAWPGWAVSISVLPLTKLPTSVESKKKKSKRVPEQHSLLLHWLLCESQWTVENSSRWKYLSTLPPFWEICIQVKKQHLEVDKEKWIGSKLGKGYIKVVYCHPAYLIYMQSTSCKMSYWMTQAGIKIARRNVNIGRWHHPYGRKWRTKELSGESERGECKSWLKTQNSK